MILYKNNAEGFLHAVNYNTIVSDIENSYITNMGRRVGQSERNSWNNSMRFMETAIRLSNIPGDCGILIEYNIPSTSKRIDFIVSGHDENDRQNFIIVELKQWDHAHSTDKEDLVLAPINRGLRETAHPSYQAYSYKSYLKNMNEGIYSSDIHAEACAYLHNYNPSDPEPLMASQYQEIVLDTPVFFRSDVEKLTQFIKKYVGQGRGDDILYQIEYGRIKPSKKLIESVDEMFDGNDAFILLDEQKVAYSNIMKYALSANQKTTIIVNGGPGTGKSVVGMNAFVGLLQQEKNIKFVAPNAAFRAAISEALVKPKSGKKGKTQATVKTLFSGSAGFFDASPNEFDVIICDEAHRLKKKGAYMYKGESQAEDIINASLVNVFFIDDNQMIRPDDEGSTARVIEAARKYGSTVYEVELTAQFRCAGAEGFINWIDHTLQIRDTGNYAGWDQKAFEFGIVDDPNELVTIIKGKNESGENARVLAGFAWPWTSDKNGNRDANIPDVVIEEHNFAMPWNSRTGSDTWAIDDTKQNQIGCIHTSQGLEFDYVGIIIGNDLRFDLETTDIYADISEYKDAMGKRGLKNNPEELSKLVKNIYKVLLSRGMKGCYVYCRDQELARYFKDRLKLAKSDGNEYMMAPYFVD